jgi:dihydroorotate dehydrogenase (NAD+) catalytic subunit
MVEQILKELGPFLAFGGACPKHYDTPVVVSVSADTAEEFAVACEELSLPEVAAIEANISCPNLEADGMAFAMAAETTYKAISAIRRRTPHPLWVKLTPNVSDVAR